MTEILTAIQDKLGTVQEFKYVDENWGQLDDYSSHSPVKWPCVLIDIQDGLFSDIGPDRTKTPVRRQQGTYTIAFDIANLKLSNSSGKAPAGQKEKAFFLKGLTEDAHKVLHGFRPAENSGALMRSKFRKIKRDDGIQQYQVIYTIGVNDV